MSTTDLNTSSGAGQELPPEEGGAAEVPTPRSGKGAPADQGLDRALLLVASCVVLGAVMSILDTTVVNVAIKTLASDFNSPLATIQWVATGYTLALATVIPITGWGAERFGTKRLYMTSIALFVLGSVLSGLAWSSTSLIVFRVLQGFGGGMLMPAGMTILTRAAGPQRVGRVMSVMGVPMLLGPVFGPILGGWLVDDFSWRWIFYINVPIGLAAFTLSLRILPKDEPQTGHRLDWVGLLLLSPSLALMIYGLAESSNQGGFGHPKVIGPIVAGVVLLISFLLHAVRAGDDALIDLKLFRNRTFTAATATLSLLIISVFGGMLLLPLYLQEVRFESALKTGLLLAPQGIGAMIAMPLGGLLTDRTGIGRIVPGGLVLIALSFIGLTQLSDTTSYTVVGGLLFVQGIGMGFAMMPTFSGAMQTLRRTMIPKASSALNIIQQVSASVGTAVMVIILTHETTSHLAGAGGSSGGSTSGTDLSRLPAAVQKVVLPRFAESFGATFWWAMGLVVLAIVVALILLPKHKPEPVDEEDGEDVSAAVMMG